MIWLNPQVRLEEALSDDTRKCTRCVTVKSATEFLTKKTAKGTVILRQPCKACMKIARDENPEPNRLRAAAWRAADPDRAKAGTRASRLKYLDERRAYDRERRSGDDGRAQNAHRRATALGLIDTLTGAEIAAIRAEQANRCSFCDADISDGGHLDHKIAMSRGGPNTKENVHLTCQPCNSEKYNRDPDEFMSGVSVPRK